MPDQSALGLPDETTAFYGVGSQTRPAGQERESLSGRLRAMLTELCDAAKYQATDGSASVEGPGVASRLPTILEIRVSKLI